MKVFRVFVLGLPLFGFALADCGNFTVAKRTYGDTTYEKTGASTMRVSALVDCINGGNTLGAVKGGQMCNSTNCALAVVPDFLVLLNRTLNISTSETVSNNLFNLAKNDFQTQDHINFHNSWAYEITGVSTCISQGFEGFWGFTPLYRCIDGTVSQCDGDGFPDDGTPVQLCGVGTLTSENYADGTLAIVQTSGQQEMPAPANATKPADQINTSNADKAVAPVLLLAAVLSTLLLV